MSGKKTRPLPWKCPLNGHQPSIPPDHEVIIGPGGLRRGGARELEHLASHRRAGGQRSAAAAGAGSSCLRLVGSTAEGR